MLHHINTDDQIPRALSCAQFRLFVLQWHKLPAAVTALILQELDLDERLAAARVCQTWTEAAALATSSINWQELSASQLPGLQLWLQQRGQQLTSLELDITGRAVNAVLQLPELSQLCKLMLVGCKLQLPSGACRQRTSSPAALMPHLTSLQLGGFLLSTSSTLLQLTRVTSLRSLKLGGRSGWAIRITHKWHDRPKRLSQALCAVLQHNTQLTRLHVWGLVLEDAALAALSSLQQLQDCRVGICDSSSPSTYRSAGILFSFHRSELAGYASPDVLTPLPPSLTSLRVREGRPRDYNPTHNSLPQQLPQLASLRRLCLDNAQFLPSALAGMIKLQRLSLDCCLVGRWWCCLWR